MAIAYKCIDDTHCGHVKALYFVSFARSRALYACPCHREPPAHAIPDCSFAPLPPKQARSFDTAALCTRSFPAPGEVSYLDYRRRDSRCLNTAVFVSRNRSTQLRMHGSSLELNPPADMRDPTHFRKHTSVMLCTAVEGVSCH